MKCMNYPNLTATQKDALLKEAKKQAKIEFKAQYDFCAKILDNAIILSLRDAFGFGEKRLKRAYFALFKMHKDLMQMYDADKNEDLYAIYEDQLHNLGFDPKQWEKELTDELERIDG